MKRIDFERIFDNIRRNQTMVHCITNYVTINDVANMILAIGASPIMADDWMEVREITAMCDSLVINMGTLKQNTVRSMLLAGKEANQRGHLVVFDPVGVGASRFRKETAAKLLKQIHFNVIRGNISEIKTLYEGSDDGYGVDAKKDDAVTEDNMEYVIQMAKNMAKKTKAVIVNTPNNPTGVVYSEETIKKLAAIMEEKQKEFGTEIYLISDEPYRELAYDGVEVPYLTKYYDNTIVGYSYSKSLSLPGERIGYLVIPDEVCDSEKLNAAANVATRILGFVNAPTLQQKVVKACLNEQTDISYYDRNRETLYNGLKELGFECIKPEGAFYLFVKSPVADEKKFCNAAKKHNILLVPGSSFGCPGYVRMAYCVAYETIVNSLPKFKELAEEYK